jgi:hypothetical protein
VSDPTLRSLLDRQAIGELIHRYCRSIDEPLGHSIFHPDATADYGAFYQGSGHGAIDAICASHRHLRGHSHQITTTTIAIDGDHAGSEAYHFATVCMDIVGEPMLVSIWGRYLDRWSRRDGCWGIDHRQVIRDMDEIRAVSPASAETTGRRDRDDPSYVILAVEQAGA